MRKTASGFCGHYFPELKISFRWENLEIVMYIKSLAALALHEKLATHIWNPSFFLSLTLQIQHRTDPFQSYVQLPGLIYTDLS